MFIKEIVLFTTVLFLQSCSLIMDNSQVSDKEIETLKSEKKLTYKKVFYKKGWKDSIQYTTKEYDVTYQNGNSYLIAKNKGEDRLIGYELSTQEKIFDIPSSKLSFPIELGEVASVYVHNFDSIFIAQTRRVTLLDSLGNIKSQFGINDGRSKYALGNLHGEMPIFYDAKTESLYFQTYCWKCPQHKTSYYTSHVSSSLNLKTKEVQALPVSYPISYQKNYYGYANHVYGTYTDSLNIYTFPMTPNIYVYNRYTENYQEFGGKSQHQKQSPYTLSRQQKDDDKAKIEHFNRATLYYKVHYDPFRNYYYRFFSPALPEKNEKGLFTKYSDREHILMIFDKQFKLIDEIKLEEKYQVFFTFCTPEGLYVSRINEKEGKGLYTIFKINIQ